MRLHIPAIALLVAVAAADKVVETKFHKVQLPPNLVHISRRETPDLGAINNITGGGYYSELEVGTPGQKVLLMLDTGSSDTWVVSNRADLCNSRPLTQKYGGCTATYNSANSSTYKLVDANGFDITYLDGRNILGSYITDDVAFDGKIIASQQLGLATRTVKGTGLMGLGFSENVASLKKYPTILDSMVTQGHIGRKAFSLYLNDLQSSEGTLLFGGVDTEKYIGKLTTVPLVPDFQSGRFTSYSVALTSISIETPDGLSEKITTTSFNASTVLDSGSTLSLLPERLALTIWQKFNIVVADYAFVDCKYAGEEGKNTFFDFQFEGVTIRVPLEEMILDNLGSIMDQLTGIIPFERICLFGIQSSGAFGISRSDFALLGDTFLRSAYVVYDETNRQVGLAQANLNSTKSNIIELAAGDSLLPTVTGVASQETLAPTTSSTSGGSQLTSTGATQTPTETRNVAARPGPPGGMDGIGILAITSIFAVFGGMLVLL